MSGSARKETVSGDAPWVRRFIASGPRLWEAIAAYEEAGFEVRLDPLPFEGAQAPLAAGMCAACLGAVREEGRIVATRPKGDVRRL